MKKRPGGLLRLSAPTVFSLSLLLAGGLRADLGCPVRSFVFCANDEQGLVNAIQEVPIPVGCLVPNCCEDCDENTKVDWRITMDRDLFKRAELRFEGLSREDFDRVGKGGCFSGVSSRGDMFVLKKSATRLTRLPQKSRLPGSGSDTVPVGFFTLELRDDAVAAQREFTIRVEQSMRGEVIDVTELKIQVELCVDDPSQGDRIELSNHNPEHKAELMLDYFGLDDGQCRNDEVRQASSVLPLLNITQSPSCRADVAVFSVGRKFVLDDNVTTWTAAQNEKHDIALEESLTVPVTVWLKDSNFKERAEIDLKVANFLYYINRVGVQLTADASAYKDASAILTGDNCPPNNVPPPSPPPHHADRLNVYYVDNKDLQGMHCNLEPEIIYIGTYANVATLAHEAGHALGLDTGGFVGGGHVNGMSGFDCNNLMVTGGGASRDSFTLGQTFRLNVHTTSLLNTLVQLNGTTIRDGEVKRDCPVPADGEVATPDCPKLSPTPSAPMQP